MLRCCYSCRRSSWQLGPRSLEVPLAWFPRLREATPEQREDLRLIGEGISIHWPQLDEDLSVRGLLFPHPEDAQRVGAWSGTGARSIIRIPNEAENETAQRLFPVPMICGAHVSPPSVVRRIVPKSPTAVPVSASQKDTAKR